MTHDRIFETGHRRPTSVGNAQLERTSRPQEAHLFQAVLKLKIGRTLTLKPHPSAKSVNERFSTKSQSLPSQLRLPDLYIHVESPTNHVTASTSTTCISSRSSNLELGREDSPVVDGVVEKSPGGSETAEVESAPDVRLAVYTSCQQPSWTPRQTG